MNPGLLTRRAAELLAKADVVLYDRLVHPSALALAPDEAERVTSARRRVERAGVALVRMRSISSSSTTVCAAGQWSG